MDISGVKHKRYMVYINKKNTESINCYNERLWFIVNNITKKTYDELVWLSNYYYNIYFKGMVYETEILTTLNSLDCNQNK